jgi:hypothetical protein
MHRDLMDLSCLAGIERGLSSKHFVAELHDQGLTRDEAAETVSQVFGVSRGAARLFIRSHPAWAGIGRDGPRSFDGEGSEPCW